MWTEFAAPGAMSPKEHASVCVGTDPVIEHVPAPAYAGAMDQLTPVPAGSGSLNATAVAVPVPGAFEFETVTLKPIGSPVLTIASSAVLVIARLGQLTVTELVACTSGWFVEWTVAVFG